MKASIQLILARKLKNKAALYFLILILIFFLIETTIRFNEDSVFALQEKALVKLQMFVLRKQTDIVFIGSSRTQDGIEPDVITHTLGSLNPNLQSINVFNGGSAGSSLDRLAYFADKSLDKPGLKILAVEVSGPQLKDNNWTPSFYSALPATDTEDFLQKKLSEYLYTVRYRKSFRIDSILRSPLLFMANSSDGTEVFRRSNIRQWYADSHIELTDDDRAAWQSSILYPKEPAQFSSPLKQPAQKYAEIYLNIAKKAKIKNVKLFLFVPPVTGSVLIEECDNKHRAIYQQVANLTQSPLLLHSCVPLRPAFFYKSDNGHLNKIGRTVWSKKISTDILNPLLTKQEI
ncbi:MAG: hypothetical protein OEY29_09985 [Gammaproteobacteria bacterium]|nr:hypothetical protein [Gammaproteobacteria bacterium]